MFCWHGVAGDSWCGCLWQRGGGVCGYTLVNVALWRMAFDYEYEVLFLTVF